MLLGLRRLRGVPFLIFPKVLFPRLLCPFFSIFSHFVNTSYLGMHYNGQNGRQIESCENFKQILINS